MTDPTDTGDHHFTQQDVDAILGVVEPPDDDTAAAERADRIARAMAELVAGGADPAALRGLAAEVWHSGWIAGWDQRGHPGAPIGGNPYETRPS